MVPFVSLVFFLLKDHLVLLCDVVSIASVAFIVPVDVGVVIVVVIVVVIYVVFIVC